MHFSNRGGRSKHEKFCESKNHQRIAADCLPHGLSSGDRVEVCPHLLFLFLFHLSLHASVIFILKNLNLLDDGLMVERQDL
jgi:hypothetical protein